MAVKVLQKLEDTREDGVFRPLNLLRKNCHVHFQYFLEKVAKLMGIPANGKNFANDGGIGLAVQSHTIQGVDNPNNLTESAIEGAKPRTTRRNQGSVDIEQKQLHAAILSEGEFYFRLQKDFRRFRVNGKFESAGLFLADKADRQGREQHLIFASA
jgi:hypothetical protein